MITYGMKQNRKQRMSAEAAERFSTRNATAFLSEITQKWKECKTSKNTFANTYRTNSFVMRNV
jgi:hypothetical protein